MRVKGNKHEKQRLRTHSVVVRVTFKRSVKCLNVKVLKPSGTFKLLLIVWACGLQGYLVLLFKMTFSVFFLLSTTIQL